jgi:phage terminase large subunit
MNKKAIIQPGYNPVFKDFLQNWDKQYRYQILYGGAGSSKSYHTAMKIISRIRSESPHRFLVVRKVASTMRQSVFQLLKQIIYDWNIEDEFQINNSEIKIIHLRTKNEIVFNGVDNPEKLKSITGITSVWIEEATELTKEDYMQLTLRVRGIYRNPVCFYITFNPISNQHWLFEYVNTIQDNKIVLKTTFLDNYFLDDEYKRRMRDLKEEDELYYQIYALGEWGEPLKGLIYKKWKIVRSIPDELKNVPSVYGIDFAQSSPTAMVELKMSDNLLWVREIFYERNVSLEDLKGLLEKHKIPKDVEIYCDSAYPRYIEELQKEYLAYPSDKSVKEGIGQVAGYNMYIDEMSDNLIMEIKRYKWREKIINGNVVQLDEPVKMWDHCLDSLRYIVSTHSRNAQPTFFASQSSIKYDMGMWGDTTKFNTTY